VGDTKAGQVANNSVNPSNSLNRERFLLGKREKHFYQPYVSQGKDAKNISMSYYKNLMIKPY